MLAILAVLLLLKFQPFSVADEINGDNGISRNDDAVNLKLHSTQAENLEANLDSGSLSSPRRGSNLKRSTDESTNVYLNAEQTLPGSVGFKVNDNFREKLNLYLNDQLQSIPIPETVEEEAYLDTAVRAQLKLASVRKEQAVASKEQAIAAKEHAIAAKEHAIAGKELVITEKERESINTQREQTRLTADTVRINRVNQFILSALGVGAIFTGLNIGRGTEVVFNEFKVNALKMIGTSEFVFTY